MTPETQERLLTVVVEALRDVGVEIAKSLNDDSVAERLHSLTIGGAFEAASDPGSAKGGKATAKDAAAAKKAADEEKAKKAAAAEAKAAEEAAAAEEAEKAAAGEAKAAEEAEAKKKAAAKKKAEEAAAKKAEEEAAAKKAEEEAEDTDGDAAPATIDDTAMAQKIQAVLAAGIDKPAIIEVLESFGGRKLAEVDKAKWPELAAALDQMLVKAAAE